MPPPSLAEARRGTWKQQASVTSLQLQRERGVALQRRAARAFLIIGFVTTLLGYGADFVTTEGVFEPVIPRKAANLFLSRDGTLKLGDLGVSTQLHGTLARRRTVIVRRRRRRQLLVG